jgi:hypothetical protein
VKTLLLLRLMIVLHAVLAFLQPVLAGTYLSGTASANVVHDVGGDVIALIGMVQLVAAVLYWRPGRGRGWPAWVAGGLMLADTAQIGVGYSRLLYVHIPLGVAIVATSLIFAMWAVRPR